MPQPPELSDQVRAWLAEETKDREFLDRSRHLIPNAIAVRNHGFFLIRAERWLHVVQLQWRLGRSSLEILSSLQCYLQESLKALELSSPFSPTFIYGLFSAALTLGDLRTAHFLTSLPDGVWGLLVREVEQRTLVEAWITFALLRGNDGEALRSLEALHELCFEVKPPTIITHDIQRARLVYPVLYSLVQGSTIAFTTDLIALAEWEEGHLSARSPVAAISAAVTKLGFARLAQLRAMVVVVKHPSIPCTWIDPRLRLAEQNSEPNSAG